MAKLCPYQSWALHYTIIILLLCEISSALPLPYHPRKTLNKRIWPPKPTGGKQLPNSSSLTAIEQVTTNVQDTKNICVSYLYNRLWMKTFPTSKSIIAFVTTSVQVAAQLEDWLLATISDSSLPPSAPASSRLLCMEPTNPYSVSSYLYIYLGSWRFN